MFGLGTRTQRVVVAVVYDPQRQGFLLVYNPRWGGYAFPTRPFPSGNFGDALHERQAAEREARRALRDDLGADLGESTAAHWMERVEVTGVSGRTEKRTHYIYDVVQVVPVHPLPAGSFASPFGFLTAQAIRAGGPEGLITWTTRQALEHLLDQHATVAVVRRVHAGQREYLMTLNRHARFFFPARRMGDQVPAERLAVYEFRLGADYNGAIEPRFETAVHMQQTTAHLGPRQYTFHLVNCTFPDEDLTVPGNRLEAALDRAGIPFRWTTEAELRNPPDILSDTAGGLGGPVLNLG